MTGRLAGRTIAVIGAGSRPPRDGHDDIGNGRAVAVLAAREGAAVVCADRDEPAARSTAQRIESEGGTASVVVVDISDELQCEALVDALAGSELDGLVLNVGIARGVGVQGTLARDWDVTMAVNLRGHFLVIRSLLPVLHDQSSIVFVSSIASIVPGSNSPAYDSSKAALAGLCRHVAYEAAPRGIPANVVALGLIDSPVGAAAAHHRPERASTRIPLGRQGTPWEGAAAVVFMLSADASYVTGQMLAVDGGVTLTGLAPA